MKSPLVSLIVPIYNVEPYILRCLNSLANQTYKNCEFVFIDDCSTDSSVLILKKFLEQHNSLKARVIQQDQNRGLSAARNIGVSSSSGEWILHVDSDDYLASDAVELLVRKIIETNADIVIGDFINVYKNRSFTYNHKLVARDQLLDDVICRRVPCCIWGKLIRKELVIKNKIWSIDGVNFSEDYAVMTRLLDVSKRVCYLSVPIYFYNRSNVNSISRKVDEKIFLKHFAENNDLCHKISLYSKLLLIKKFNSEFFLRKVNSSFGKISSLSSTSLKDKIILQLCDLKLFNCILTLQKIKTILLSSFDILRGYISK